MGTIPAISLVGAGVDVCARAPTALAGWAAYDGRMDDYWLAVVWSLLPTVVVSAIFVFVLRSILRMDRSERKTYARVEAEERAKRGLPPRVDA